MCVEVRVVLLLLLLPAVCLPAEPPVEELKGTVMYTCIYVRDHFSTQTMHAVSICVYNII